MHVRARVIRDGIACAPPSTKQPKLTSTPQSPCIKIATCKLFAFALRTDANRDAAAPIGCQRDKLSGLRDLNLPTTVRYPSAFTSCSD